MIDSDILEFLEDHADHAEDDEEEEDSNELPVAVSKYESFRSVNLYWDREPGQVYENGSVFVIAQRYPEKRAIITTNDDDNVCRHQPITIFDFFDIHFLLY